MVLSARLPYWIKWKKSYPQKILNIAGSICVGYTVLGVSGYSVAQINGRSMQPTFNPHLGLEYRPGAERSTGLFKNMFSFIRHMFSPLDWVLISSKDRFNIQTGDIVIFNNPQTPTDRDIKRVRATQHQCVSTRSYKNKTVIVPKGYIWVEGDNTILSKDSDIYGPIPAALVYAKAVAIIWPPDRWKRLVNEPLSPPKRLNASEMIRQDSVEDGETDD